MLSNHRITRGSYRCLTADEQKDLPTKCGCRPVYKYIITTEYKLTYEDKTLIVPPGFKSDGASWGPDNTDAWVFHDYLYVTHRWSVGGECTKDEADAVMRDILNQEKRECYSCCFQMWIYCNPCGAFDRSYQDRV